MRIANLYGEKIVAMFCLITSEVLKLEGLKNLSEVNILTATQVVKRKFVKVQQLNFLTYFSCIVNM